MQYHFYTNYILKKKKKKTSNTNVDVDMGKWISGIKIGECF